MEGRYTTVNTTFSFDVAPNLDICETAKGKIGLPFKAFNIFAEQVRV